MYNKRPKKLLEANGCINEVAVPQVRYALTSLFSLTCDLDSFFTRYSVNMQAALSVFIAWIVRQPKSIRVILKHFLATLFPR